MRTRLFNIVRVLLFFVMFLPATTLGNDGNDPAELLFHFANGLYKRELYKLAISQYQKFIAQYPDNPKKGEATFLLGESHFKLENFSEATDAYTLYVTDYPDGKSAGVASFRIGYFKFSKSDYSAAIAPLNKALTFDIEGTIRAQTNYYLGKSHYEMGNYPEAIKCLNEVSGEASAQLRPHALFTIATSFEKIDDPSNALETFNQLLGEFPDHNLVPVALLHAAELLFNFERYKEAASRLEDLLALRHEELIEVAQHRLAWCYYLLKDTEKLSGMVDGFLSRFPDSKYRGEIVFLEAETAYEQGNDEVALTNYLEVVESVKKEDFVAQSYYKLGLIYEKRKEHNKAVDAFNTLDSDYASHTLSAAAVIQAAQIYEKELNNPSEALTRYKRYLATAQDGQHTELAIFRSATCQFAMGEYDDMANTLEQFAIDFPDSPWIVEAVYYIGWNYERKKDYENAITYYEQLLKSYPEESLSPSHPQGGSGEVKEDAAFDKLMEDARFRLALCYYNTKRHPEAAKAYYEILSQTKIPAEKKIPEEVLLWLGEYFSNENDYEKGVAVYKMLLEENPETKWLERGLYRLGEWNGKLGEWKESIVWYNGMLAVFPNSELAKFARLGIAQAHEKLKEFPEAVALYENLAKGDTTVVGARANLGLGNIHAAQKDYENAVLSYMYVAILYDDAEICSSALLGASDCWLAQGDAKQSVAALKELLERYPDGPYASEAKKRLQDIEGT